MIRFTLVESGAGGYYVEPLDLASRPFAWFVNMDVFGEDGVRELLGQVRDIRAGVLSGLEETRNAYDISVDGARVRLEFPPSNEVAECPTPDFEAFLAEILRRVNES